MYRQKSLSKLSSKSLSKIKNKIELAFSKPQHPLNPPQSSQKTFPSRSKSVKSLAKSRCDTSENNIPFAVALKTGLIQSNRKSKNATQVKSVHHGPEQTSNTRTKYRGFWQQTPLIRCSRTIENECIKGFSWFSREEREMVSQCKKGDGQVLRYFAVKEGKNGKGVLKVIAAIEEDVLYLGDKSYILLTSNKTGIISQDQSTKATLKGLDFVLIISVSLLSICNMNRMLADIYALFRDGVDDLDIVTSILSRKISEMVRGAKKGAPQNVSFLVLLLENRLQKYQEAEIQPVQRG